MKIFREKIFHFVQSKKWKNDAVKILKEKLIHFFVIASALSSITAAYFSAISYYEQQELQKIESTPQLEAVLTNDGEEILLTITNIGRDIARIKSINFSYEDNKYDSIILFIRAMRPYRKNTMLEIEYPCAKVFSLTSGQSCRIGISYSGSIYAEHRHPKPLVLNEIIKIYNKTSIEILYMNSIGQNMPVLKKKLSLED